MLTSVRGIYENGSVRLLEPLSEAEKTPVIVTVLEALPLPSKERSEAVRTLLALREQSPAATDAEIREARESGRP